MPTEEELFKVNLSGKELVDPVDMLRVALAIQSRVAETVTGKETRKAAGLR